MLASLNFLNAINGYLKSYPVSEWKNYLKYHLVRNLSGYMDDKTYTEFFSFYSGTLRGVKEPKPRWKRVVQQTDGSLGELIGQVYVEEYLPNGTKEKMIELLAMIIKTVFAERIKSLDWMSSATKEKALNKLSFSNNESRISRQMERSEFNADRPQFVCKKCNECQ